MNAQQLFQAMESIDERFIQEAAETRGRAVPWRAIGATAAVLAVALGSVWVSQMALRRPENTPQTLSTPTVSAPPSMQPSALPSAEAALSEPEPIRTETVPEPVEESSGSSGETCHEPPYRAEYVHSDDGDFLVFTPLLPSDPNGPVTLDITGQLENGHYAARVPSLLAAQERYVELTVHEDGSYDLYWEHDPFNDTAWWLEEEANDIQ